MRLRALACGLILWTGCNGPDKGQADASAIDAADDASGMDALVTLPDASAGHDASSRDAGSTDQGSFNFGTMVATSGAIVGVTADETKVYFINGGHLFSEVFASGMRPIDLGNAPDEWFTKPSGKYFWMLYNVGASGDVGPLMTLSQTATGGPSLISSNALRNLVFRSDNTEHAIFAANLRLTGMAPTATLTADLMVTRADGTNQAMVLQDIHLGAYDRANNVFGGPCEVRAAFTSSTSALLALCKDPNVPGPKSLIEVDTERGTMRTIAENVHDFLRIGADGTYAVFRDETLHIQGVDLATNQVIPLDEALLVGGPRILDQKRFAYLAQNTALKVASFPRMEPGVVGTGVRGPLAVSLSGEFVMFYQTRDVSGTTDLFAVSTSTDSQKTPIQLDPNPDAVPGDAPFSDDSLFALWIQGSDANGIGTVMSRSLDSTGRINTIASAASSVLTYAEPNAVLVFVNARATAARITADLAVAPRDGSMLPTLLATDVDTGRFTIFPTTRSKIFFRIMTSPHQGLYVRDLPAP